MIILASVLVVLTACSENSNEGKSESNEIIAWAWDPKFNIAALELAEKAYNQDDFDMKIIENAQNDIIQKLNAGLSSGTMKGMPNIVLIEDYRAQSFLQAYPEAFYPLDDYVNIDDFAEYKAAPSSHDGKQYGLPFDTGVTGLFLRTDYLEEASLSPEDFNDITWDELIELGKTIKEKTGKDLITLDPNDLGTIRLMIQTAGEWYLNEDGTTPNIANNEAIKEAFKIYKQLLDEKIAKVTSDWSQMVGALNNGDVAAQATGNWIIPSIMAEESQAGDWIVAPIPRLNIDGAVNRSNLGGSSFYVLNIDGKEKAAEFLGETFGKNIEFYEELIDQIGALGTFTAAASSETYQKENEYFSNQKIFHDFATWMDEIPVVNFGMHTYAIEDILVSEMQNYLNGQPLEDVLNNAQQQAEAQLK